MLEVVPQIRRLGEAVINRIAAGEVVERPASAVKELVENALDAGAGQISVHIEEGGRGRIQVADDGIGIPRAELPLAIERHATSKLATEDLQQIRSMGFRGEALAAISGVSRFSLVSRPAGAEHAWRLEVNAGVAGEPAPAPGGEGTTVEVLDLFYATPARLGFLRKPRTEAAAVADVMRDLAVASPSTGFLFCDDGREVLRVTPESGDRDEARRARIGAVLGEGFLENAVPAAGQREAGAVWGYAGLPTHNRSNGHAQYVFVNNRPVHDRVVQGAIRGAYRDLLPRGRFPVLAIWIETEADRVDVNVHPAKSQIRFRDEAEIRALIVGSLRRALTGAGHLATSEGGRAALTSFQRQPESTGVSSGGPELFAAPPSAPGADPAVVEAEGPAPGDYPLGAARAQLHRMFILAQTENGIVLVDQHAAHERLVYERMKADLEAKGVARQNLLIPDVVELPPGDADRVLARSAELAELGLVIEPFGGNAVCVREVPQILGVVDTKGLLHDLAGDFAEDGDAPASLRSRLDAVCSRMACHSSIRGGRALSVNEMNQLLRDMESTPHSGQCNHGRPTYVEMKLDDLLTLFERR